MTQKRARAFVQAVVLFEIHVDVVLFELPRVPLPDVDVQFVQ